MRMYYVEHGDYQMRNHIVEFEPDVSSSGSRNHGSGTPITAGTDARWGQRWGSDSSPQGPDATLVTESTTVRGFRPTSGHAGGRIWIDAMTDTLARLDAVVTGAATGS